MKRSTPLLGSRIRLARLQLGLDQLELADQLGVTRNTVSEWETGKAEPRITTLRRLAAVSGKPMSFFYPEEAAA